MADTPIPVDADTKQRLHERKHDDETFDEFLRRVVLADDGIDAGAWSDTEADAAKKSIRESRRNWD